MRLFGFDITRTKAAPASLQTVSAGWWSILRESFAGAWQQNVEVSLETVLNSTSVYASLSRISRDVSKMPLRLVRETGPDLWTPDDNPSFSPVIRKPNHFQTPTEFIEWWLITKLVWGNAYILKQRDNRSVVTALYVLHPLSVRPLVSPDGSVFYEVKSDSLAGLDETVIVPAREMIHDKMMPTGHPLVGVSPISACGLAATQGLRIQDNSATFFANGSRPGGVLSAPGVISQDTATRLKNYWETEFSGDNAGKIAVLGDGLKYEAMSQNAVDSQLLEQLKWTAEAIAAAFQIPVYLVNGSNPTHANAEALLQQYYALGLQSHAKKIEDALDFGLGLRPDKINGVQWGTEFNTDYLILMDSAAKGNAAVQAVGAGVLSPNEARARYYNAGEVDGGNTPYMQEQNWPLAYLEGRELPTRPPTPPEQIEPADEEAKAATHRRMPPPIEGGDPPLLAQTNFSMAPLISSALMAGAAKLARKNAEQVIHAN